MLTFKEAADVYRQRLRMEGRLTPDTDRRIGKLVARFGAEQLVDVTKAKWRDYVAEVYGSASAATVNRNQAVLSAIMHVAEDEGAIVSVPRYHRTKGARSRNTHLQIEEIMPVVERVREVGGAIAGFTALLLIDTGMRFGEAMDLTWGDLREDWITVGRAAHGHSKTRERKIPTSPRLLEFMVKHGILPLSTEAHSTPIVLSRWNGRRQNIGKALNEMLKVACVEAGAMCGAEIRVHDLRHTFAFMCASAGADIADIRDLLGHANINMTLRYKGFVETRAAALVRRATASMPRSGITGLEGVEDGPVS